MPEGRLGVGVVGIGFGQAAHVPAFRSDPRCDVRAICASTPARATAAAERLGIPAVYPDWPALVTAPELDLIAIAVPPQLQPLVAVAAAKAGKHVFCEKPMALDAASAKAMLDAVRAAGVAHAIDFEFAELPAYAMAARIYEEGVLGALVSASFSWRHRTRRHDATSWKERPELGGGVMGGFATHVTFLLDRLFGPPLRVAARLGPAIDECETRFEAWLELHDGQTASISIATDAVSGIGQHLEICGRDATLVVDNATPDLVRGFTVGIARRRSDHVEELPCPDLAATDDPRAAAVGTLVRRLVDAARGGAPVRPDLSDGYRAQRQLDSLRLAARTGAWVEP